MQPADIEAKLSRFAARFPRDFLTTFDEAPQRPIASLSIENGPASLRRDPVYQIGDPAEEILHFHFLAGDLNGKAGDLLACNGFLFYQFGVPVHTLAILLQPENPSMFEDGQVHYSARPGRGSMFFHFETVAIADRLVEELLSGPPATLPLAVLAKLPVSGDEINGVRWIANHIRERCDKLLPAEEAREILDLARDLSALRIPPGEADRIFLA